MPSRLLPIFRDRDELGGSSELSASLVEALRASRFLIVICSPRSGRSRWVDEEVRQFEALRRMLASDPYLDFRLKPGAKRVVTFLRGKPRVPPRLPIELGGACIVRMSEKEVFSAYVPSPRGPVVSGLSRISPRASSCALCPLTDVVRAKRDSRSPAILAAPACR